MSDFVISDLLITIIHDSRLTTCPDLSVIHVHHSVRNDLTGFATAAFIAW